MQLTDILKDVVRVHGRIYTVAGWRFKEQVGINGDTLEICGVLTLFELVSQLSRISVRYITVTHGARASHQTTPTRIPNVPTRYSIYM